MMYLYMYFSFCLLVLLMGIRETLRTEHISVDSLIKHIVIAFFPVINIAAFIVLFLECWWRQKDRVLLKTRRK